MSLAEAVLAVAGEMEKDAEGCVHTEDACLIKSYAKQLRLIVKASQSTVSNTSSYEDYRKSIAESIAKQEALKAKNDAEFHEQEGQMVELHGGGSDGVWISCPPNLPIGHRGVFNSEVYVKTKDGICFSQELTDKFVLEREKE